MDQDRKNQINDCIFEVLGRRPTLREVYFVNENLPREVKLLAEEHGWNDTEVANMTLKWVKENRNKITLE